MLPVLLPCSDPTARDIMAIIGDCGSPKEVVMAVQEAIEQLERLLDSDVAVGDNDDRRSDDKEGCQSIARKSKLNSTTTQLTILIDLYGSCKFCIGQSECFLILKYTKAISRMKLRRKSAPDTLRPLLNQLQKAIQLTVPMLSTHEGRAIISGITVLCRKIAKWAETVAREEHEDTRLSKVGNSPMSLLGLRSMTV